MLLRLAWRCNLVHVSLWDNTPSPVNYDYEPAQALPPLLEEMLEEAAAESEAVPKTMNWGAADPTQVQQIVQLWEKQCEEANAHASWDYSRYDGKGGSIYDFSKWHRTDDEQIALRKYSKKKRENYIKVRPLVLQGLTNVKISQVTEMSTSWVDEYAGAVRAAFRARKDGE